MKTKSLRLKVCATLFVLFFFGKNAEAQTRNWEQIFNTYKSGFPGDVSGIDIYDSQYLIVWGNFDQVQNLKTLTYLNVSNVFLVNRTTNEVINLNNNVENPKVVKSGNDIYLVGTYNNETSGEVLKLNKTTKQFLSIKTVSTSINTAAVIGQKMILGCKNGVQILDLQSLVVTTTTITNNTIALDQTEEYLAVTFKYNSLMFGGTILDANTLQSATVDPPSDLGWLSSFGASNNKLYISYIPSSGSGVTAVYDENTSSWKILGRDNSSVGMWGFYEDTSNQRLYCTGGQTQINGININSGLVYYKDAQWNSLGIPSGVETGRFVVDGDNIYTAGRGIYFYQSSIISSIANNQTVSVKVYPNPTSDCLRLLSPEAIDVPLFTLTGQVLQTISLQKNIETEIDISNLPTGTYFVGGEKISKL